MLRACSRRGATAHDATVQMCRSSRAGTLQARQGGLSRAHTCGQRSTTKAVLTGRFRQASVLPAEPFVHWPPKRGSAMRVVLIVAALLLVAVSGAILVPAAEPIRPYLSEATLALAILVLIGVFSQLRQKAPPRKPVVEPVRPAPIQSEASRADAEIVHFLAMLQEQGRLIDFLMDDINPYSDAQVGAAARIVHAGCKGILQEHFSINPVRPEPEGIDGAGSSRVFSRRVSAGRQDCRTGTFLRRACPPWLEDGYGEVAAVAARHGRPATRHRSRGGGSDMTAAAWQAGQQARSSRTHISQDARFHEGSLQSRDRPRHEQLRDGAD